MHIHYTLFIVTGIILDVLATPYFKPWLETRQNPTPGEIPVIHYPAHLDGHAGPVSPTNLFAADTVLTPVSGPGGPPGSRRKRSLHNSFRVPRSITGRGIHRREITNGSCTQIASFSFNDWEKGSSANTPTITLPGKANYLLSIAANVNVQTMVVWTNPVNSNDYKSIANSNPGNFTGTLAFSADDHTQAHFQFFFQYGHPNGQVALFTDAIPGVGILKRRRRIN